MESPKWKTFELNCFNELVQQYSHLCKIKYIGESDSTQNDVEIKTSTRNFAVEVKSSIAQCGQFVLLPDNNKFVYSPNNKYKINKESQKILDYMNDNFDTYFKAGTKGVSINLDESIFTKWIKDYYLFKNVQFVMTKSKNYLIFPIDSFEKYFEVTAKYRVKKSGSGNLSKKNANDVKAILDTLCCPYTLFFDGEKAVLNTKIILDDKIVDGPNFSYLFRKIAPDTYTIRQLSNTYNANVIFSISLKRQTQDPMDLLMFENALTV